MRAASCQLASWRELSPSHCKPWQTRANQGNVDNGFSAMCTLAIGHVPVLLFLGILETLTTGTYLGNRVAMPRKRAMDRGLGAHVLVAWPIGWRDQYRQHSHEAEWTLFTDCMQIVYLPAKRDQEPRFESFSAPILKFQDSSTSSSMWWGWVWKSDCIPVSGGGIPPDIPRIEVRFTFSDGGMMDFNETYIRLRERLYQFHEMRREMGAGADVPDEPLPAYEEQSSAAPGSASASGSAAAASAPSAAAAASSAGRRPDEPPPNYDEAQAQQISIRLEDHIRDGANRGDSA